jgi:DNA-directed RNA polymerase subunit RPC12/RpoP
MKIICLWTKCVSCHKLFTITIFKGFRGESLCPYCGKKNK